MSNISVALLASSQPTVGGINLVITSTYNPIHPIVSFQYFVYPGDNANSDANGNPLANSIYNRTVNVGSPQATTAGSGVYSLFVETTQLFPNYDYNVIVLAVYSDGTNSGYSQHQLLPLTPAAINLEPYAVTLTRNPASYATEATITVRFTNVTLPPGVAASTISYNLGIQYKTGHLATTKFMVSHSLNYDTTIGGVQALLTDSNGIDEAWVAIQAVRTITVTNVKASSQLSNTLFANDTDIPLPPRNLTGDYHYYDPTPNVVLSWLPSYYEQLGNISGYNVYRINPNGTTVKIGYVSQRSGPFVNTPYTFTDSALNEFTPGQVIQYFVKTLETNNVESIPSNVVSFSIMFRSSAPRNLNAIGVANPNTSTTSNPGTQDVTAAFQNPATVNGLLVNNYTLAFFETKMIDTTTNTVISTINTNYDVNKGSNYYVVSFNNEPFTPNGSNTQAITIRTRLITFQNNGDQQLGIEASINITVGPKPIYLPLSLNENLTWTNYTGLQGFRIISATMLTDSTVTAAEKSNQTASLFSLNNVAPTVITDSYSPFNGCYEYQVPSSLLPNQDTYVIIQATASNQYGTTQPLISDSIFLPSSV